MARAFDHVVLSCEHATDHVPTAFRLALQRALPAATLRAFDRALGSHEGIDFGAQALGRTLAGLLGRPLIAARHSRLLVDCNRSPAHRHKLSRFSRQLPPAAQARLVALAYTPHRARVEAAIAQAIAAARARGRLPVVHLALHSFTPRWRGHDRNIDVGLLYDPGRPQERALAAAWREQLRLLPANLRLRRNAPYRGVADGLPTALRRRYSDAEYVGFELELSQAYTCAPPHIWRHFRQLLAQSLAAWLCKNF